MTSIPLFERLQNEANTKMGMGHLACFSDKPRRSVNFNTSVIDGNKTGALVSGMVPPSSFRDSDGGYFGYLFNPPYLGSNSDGFFIRGADRVVLESLLGVFGRSSMKRTGMDLQAKLGGQVARILDDDSLGLGGTIGDVEKIRGDLYSAYKGEKKPPLELLKTAFGLYDLDSARAFYEMTKIMEAQKDESIHTAQLKFLASKLRNPSKDDIVYDGEEIPANVRIKINPSLIAEIRKLGPDDVQEIKGADPSAYSNREIELEEDSSLQKIASDLLGGSSDEGDDEFFSDDDQEFDGYTRDGGNSGFSRRRGSIL